VHYVYILKLRNGKCYTGTTSDLIARIKKHNLGNVISTKAFKPVRLVYYSAFKSKDKVLLFEKYLKTGSGIGFRNKRLI